MITELLRFDRKKLATGRTDEQTDRQPDRLSILPQASRTRTGEEETLILVQKDL